MPPLHPFTILMFCFLSLVCVYISVVRHSINVGSYSFKTIRAPHACMYRQNIEKNACINFTVLLTSEFVVTCFNHHFLKNSQLTTGARRSAGLTVVCVEKGSCSLLNIVGGRDFVP